MISLILQLCLLLFFVFLGIIVIDIMVSIALSFITGRLHLALFHQWILNKLKEVSR